MYLSVVHNMLMIGPPGAGKTFLVRAIPSILPRMSIDEALDVTRISWIADLVESETHAPQHLAEALQYRPRGINF